MAATQTVHQSPQSHNSLVPRHGLLTLYGYGIRASVERGHLLLQDGIGRDRHCYRLARVGHGLRRLIVVGADGFVSFSALQWLADQEVSFAMLERTGKVLCVTGPVRPSDARLRRAQACADQTGIALEIARKLIDQKLAGQEQIARHKLLVTESADKISEYRTQLTTADTIAQIRLIESLAASVYWFLWRNLAINFPKKDQSRVPNHWQVFGARVSPLTGSPRVAVNPANAALNYLYCVLESESRLAAAALGLDPGLGVLHVDTTARDSLACDLMEPIRPQIDTFVLDWITRETLKREWFYEQPDGNCRLMSTLAIRLAETAPTWGRAVAPFAEWIAQRLWTSIRKPSDRDKNFPTRLTQRRRSEGRGNEFILKLKPVRHPSKICSECGAATREGQRCSKCGREFSRVRLIELAKLGRIETLKPAAQKKRSETQRRHQAERKAWLSSNKSNWPDELTYKNEIQPRLCAVTIASIASALGVTGGYAADIRVGRRRPHPRHWGILEELLTRTAFSAHSPTN